MLLGDFNARVRKISKIDDVIGMFGENVCNASRNRLVSFLNEVELVVNPRRACAARVMVVAVCVCLSVCLSVTTLAAAWHNSTLKLLTTM